MASTDPDAERTATGYEQQEIVLRGVLESGDIAAAARHAADQRGRRDETAWKLIRGRPDRLAGQPHEGARLGSAGSGAGAPKGNVCAGGVEVDEYGAPIAYHLLKKAPRRSAADARGAHGRRHGPDRGLGRGAKLPTVVHVMAKRRPEQFRGVSILAPVLEALQQVSTLTEAELFAAILQAMIAIIYKSPGAQAMPEPDYGADGAR
jgi:capsid protein